MVSEMSSSFLLPVGWDEDTMAGAGTAAWGHEVDLEEAIATGNRLKGAWVPDSVSPRPPTWTSARRGTHSSLLTPRLPWADCSAFPPAESLCIAGAQWLFFGTTGHARRHRLSGAQTARPRAVGLQCD